MPVCIKITRFISFRSGVTHEDDGQLMTFTVESAYAYRPTLAEYRSQAMRMVCQCVTLRADCDRCRDFIDE